MKETMRGIIKPVAGPGLAFRDDLAIPTINEDEVLFEVKSAAICGTDVAINAWTEWAQKRVKPPMVVGHEVAGVVIACGDKVENLKVGDRVAVETHIPCYDCELCAMDMAHICAHQEVYGCTIPGGFAEYSKVRADVAVKIPEEIDFEMGSMMEPMGAGVHGLEKAEVKDKITIINGCGPIGLMAVGAAKSHGTKLVIATDIFDSKLDVAKEMGADIVINSKDVDMVEAVKEVTHGLGADVALDFSGFGPAIINTLKSLRVGGRLVLVGLPNGEIPINLSEDLIYREIEVMGIAGRKMYETWDDVINILKNENFSLEPVIGGRYALEDFEAAFQALAEGSPGKMLLIPEMKPNV